MATACPGGLERPALIASDFGTGLVLVAPGRVWALPTVASALEYLTTRGGSESQRRHLEWIFYDMGGTALIVDLPGSGLNVARIGRAGDAWVRDATGGQP